MRDDQIAALLGLPASDPTVGRVLEQFRIKRRPSIRRDDGGDIVESQDWLLNASLGVEFGFDDRATFLAEHPDDVGQQGMMLTQIYFYGEHEGVGSYRGSFPFRLALADDRATVRGKLAAFEAKRRSYIRDTWDLPKYRLVVSYVLGGARLGFVLCALRRPSLQADRDDAERLPGADRILDQLGRPLGDPELRLALAPLKVPASLISRQGDLVGTYRFRFGLDLRFGLLPGGKDIVLAEVDFYAEHVADAVGWPGSLPFGLTFGDSPDTLLKRMGRAPDFHEDEDFQGTAVWRLPRGRMQVGYNSMENLVTRIQIFAPGR